MAPTVHAATIQRSCTGRFWFAGALDWGAVACTGRFWFAGAPLDWGAVACSPIERDGSEGPSLEEQIRKKYFPEHFGFEPFGDPFEVTQ